MCCLDVTKTLQMPPECRGGTGARASLAQSQLHTDLRQDVGHEAPSVRLSLSTCEIGLTNASHVCFDEGGMRQCPWYVGGP